MKKFYKREELEAREGRDITRMTREGASSTAYTIMVVLGVLLTILLSTRFNYQKDFSLQRTNELSPQTVEVLQRIEEPIKIWALYRTRAAVERDVYWDLLNKFQRENPNVEFEFVDPVRQPGVLQRLQVESAGDRLSNQGMSVAVQGNRRVTFTGEEEVKVVNALLEVGRGETWTIGFGVGAGMRDTGNSSNVGLANAAQSLRGEYYEVVDVPLDQPYPPRLDALVLTAPQYAFSEDQLTRLTEWLEQGGRLFALLESNDGSGLDPLLDRWGLGLDRTPLLDPRKNVNGEKDFLSISDYSKHEVVNEFGSSFALATPIVGSVRHFESRDPLVFHSDLAYSSGFSYGIRPDGKQVAGPLAVVAASWREDSEDGSVPTTRLILAGDSDFITNAYLPSANNRNFFLNSIAWLTRNQELITIRRPPLEGQKFTLERGSLKDLLLLDAAVWGAPIVVLLAGLFVWFRRRGL